ncbi:MAG TPA: hypothetical protein VF843_11465 [Streptosporangiaceae bacterium]
MRMRAVWAAITLLVAVLVAVAGATAALRLAGAPGPGGRPLSAADVRKEFARTAGQPPGQGRAAGSSRPAGPASGGAVPPVHSSVAARGGTVFAACDRGLVRLTGWIPQSGFTTERFRRGPARTAWVTFRAAGTEQTVRVTCRAAGPQFTVAADDAAAGGSEPEHGGRGGGQDGGGGHGGGSNSGGGSSGGR